MRKIVFLMILSLSGLLVNAQKENGIVYSEHEAIAKTKAMLAAFVQGDKNAYCSFFADTVYVETNGQYQLRLNKDMGMYIDWWKAFDNLSIMDDKPAYPDAIDYKEGGVWVQDWLRWKGTNKETGVNLNLKTHSLYSFDKNGKINSIHHYFNNDVFDEIYKSTTTVENGVVYRYHPYITIVRKVANAYCAEKPDKMFEYYAKDAIFSNLILTDNKTLGIEEQKKGLNNIFEYQNDIRLTETGHPVCVLYDKETFVVYSWWLLSFTTNTGVKKSGIPIMMTDIFNKEGKIQSEALYYSSNHF
jgi:hypothetical protein